MSKIQSAKELVEEIDNNYAPLSGYAKLAIYDRIHSRDRAIVERCKVALIECDEVGVDKYLFALDSVLRELEGEGSHD